VTDDRCQWLAQPQKTTTPRVLVEIEGLLVGLLNKERRKNPTLAKEAGMGRPLEDSFRDARAWGGPRARIDGWWNEVSFTANWLTRVLQWVSSSIVLASERCYRTPQGELSRDNPFDLIEGHQAILGCTGADGRPSEVLR